MAVFHHEIFIAQPVEKVFATAADPTTHPKWQEGLIGTKGDGSSQSQLGSKGTEIRRMFGRELEFPYEIIDYEPSHRWGFRALEGPVKPMALLTFSSKEGGTLVQSELTVPGLMGSILGPMLLSQQKKNYLQLKQMLEAGTL